MQRLATRSCKDVIKPRRVSNCLFSLVPRPFAAPCWTGFPTLKYRAKPTKKEPEPPYHVVIIGASIVKVHLIDVFDLKGPKTLQ
jgi:hypothetical protein